ncbi:MAG: type I DNA topoisomerase [Candidatus Nealsonbacteria bacterium]
MKLVIVESPTKCKTLEKFLGKDYKVAATMGHIRDLPEKTLGIDTEHDFDPEYVAIARRKDTIKELKETISKAEKIYLAMDPDREGEAIAWHLSELLKLKDAKRIVFNEITKQAVVKAAKNPRDIDMQLVNAQQARRILDRLVGYKLSPLLWKKITRRLSAGRVQSVAVRLVAEREKEIEDFKPQEYWSIEALFEKEEKEFKAILIKKDNKTIPKLGIKNKKETNQIIKDLKKAEYKVADIEEKERKKNPLPPFTTSTLQQTAWRRFRFSAKKTMLFAQKLYENGLITYHRTDSLNLSQQSLSQAKEFIINTYGQNYWPGFFRKYKAKGKVQEAHEAIRPTYPEKTPQGLKLDKNALRIYELIWSRFIASQMSAALFNSLKIDIAAKDYLFRANGQTLKFDGFLKVYSLKIEEAILPALVVKELLKLKKLLSLQHFTQPPPRYTEASLIKTLEENGIGRPSTYAPILSTIQLRNYIEKDEQRRFKPTEIGNRVNDLLVNHFPKIVDVGFTKEMEEDLDKIAKGEKKWVPVIKEFYKDFEKTLIAKEKEIPHKKLTYEKTRQKCPNCGSPVVIKLGRYGKFYACSNFPKCKYTKSLKKNELKIKCPKCKNGEVVEKRTKTKKIFYGCSNWPECDFATWDKPHIKKGLLNLGKKTVEQCPECKSSLVETKRGLIKCSNKECRYIKQSKQKKE